MVNLRQIEWTAGFLEGEGYFVDNKYALRIVCDQVQEEPLLRLQSYFGGKVWLLKSKRCFRWEVINRRAAGIMMTIWALMSPWRKEQIEKALVTWKTKPVRKSFKAP